MPKGLSKFYNYRTQLWYRFFHHSIRMHVAARHKVKSTPNSYFSTWNFRHF